MGVGALGIDIKLLRARRMDEWGKKDKPRL